MKRQTISIMTLVFNVILVVLSSYFLIDEFIRVGKFQWVDQNARKDHEELYLTPIIFSLVVLGLFSILHETLNLKGKKTKKLLLRTFHTLIKAMSFLNGTVLLIISNIFLSLIIGNIGNQYVEKGFVFSVSIIILSLVCVGFFGGLILYNVLPNKNNS